MIAASLGHVRAVTALLVAGADTSLGNEKGKTALDLTNEYQSPIPQIRSMPRNPLRREKLPPKLDEEPEARR